MRVHTYAHSLRLQLELLEDVGRKKRALAESLDRKRLELVQLKEVQLARALLALEALQFFVDVDRWVE